MPLSDHVLDEQAGRLVSHYRPGEPSNRFLGWVDELEQAFLHAEQVNDATFAAAVSKCIASRADRNLPLVAELRLYVEGEWHAFKRETAKRLPPPAPTANYRYSRAEWNWNVAVGSLKGRDKITDPTNEQIRQRKDELIEAKRLKPDDAPPLSRPEWPAA